MNSKKHQATPSHFKGEVFDAFLGCTCLFRKLSAAIVLFSLLTSASFSQTKERVNYKYRLYLPENYMKNASSYPLIIYLHGGGQRGNDLYKLNEYGLPYLISKGQNFKFIIASPQCPEGKYWTTDNWIDSLLIDLNAKYRIDSSRIDLTGISMGAYGVYCIAMDCPAKFAALLPLCGGCNDIDTSRICTIRNIPIWTFHGTDDDKIPISETERIVKILNTCSGKILFTRIANKGHSIQYLYETNPEIYDWLLKQKKK